MIALISEKKNHNSQLSIRTREKYYKQPTTTLSNFKQTALSTGKSRVFKVGLVLVLHLIRNYGIDVSFRDPTLSEVKQSQIDLKSFQDSF